MDSLCVCVCAQFVTTDHLYYDATRLGPGCYALPREMDEMMDEDEGGEGAPDSPRRPRPVHLAIGETAILLTSPLHPYCNTC